MTRGFWLAATLALAAPAAAPAQDVTITANVDKNAVAKDDQVVLTVTVGGATVNPPEPQLPSMPNFTIQSSGRSQSISIINGQTSGSVTYTYALTPRFYGKATIAPIFVTVQGKRVETAPIEIQVLRAGAAQAAPPGGGPAPASAQPQAGRGGGGEPDVFVTASADKRKAYVNEPITLSVRFFTAVPLLGNAQYSPPDTQGFLAEDLPPERHGQVRVHGRLYNFSEIKTALFPLQPGRLTIGRAAVRCQVPSDAGPDFGGDIFQNFFSQRFFSGQTRDLRTDPVALQIEPLPERGKPPSFTGAVGRFRVTAAVDRSRVQVGEAVALTVTIEGSGNLKALGNPPLPELPSFRAYDTVSALNVSKDQDVVHGSKTFRTVLVPRVSGALKIPSIPFSYFDPSRGTYVQAGTAPIEVQASPAAPGSPAASYVAARNAGAELTPVSEDIRYIKESTREPLASSCLTVVARGRWIHLIPVILFLLSLGRTLYEERLRLDPAGARARAALPTAHKRIREAEVQHAANATGQAAALLWDALEGFLADKLNASAAGLTLRQAAELLQKDFPRMRGESLAELKSLWEELELLRFAGSGAAQPAAVAALLARTRETLKKLDMETRR